MAQLLVRTVNGENALRYMAGDVVTVFDDEHRFGRMESLAVWIAEGNDPAAWPGGFTVVQLDGLAVEQARQYLEPVMLAGTSAPEMAQRRRYTCDHQSLERRSSSGGRDTLRTHGHIKRNWLDADVRAALRLKG